MDSSMLKVSDEIWYFKCLPALVTLEACKVFLNLCFGIQRKIKPFEHKWDNVAINKLQEKLTLLKSVVSVSGFESSNSGDAGLVLISSKLLQLLKGNFNLRWA